MKRIIFIIACLPLTLLSSEETTEMRKSRIPSKKMLKEELEEHQKECEKYYGVEKVLHPACLEFAIESMPSNDLEL